MDDTTTIGEAATSTDDKHEYPLVFLHGISRRFTQGDATLDVLRSAELAVWPGQSVALVAPSGTGKSTLLHIAGLLEHPDAGEVYIDGAATTGLSDIQRTRIRRNDIGFVYQFHHLLPEFSALENVMLPQMDGLAVIDALRARGVRMPVLILSAKRTVDDRVRGLQAGGDDYLTKPFDFAELLVRVKALLRRTPVERTDVLRLADLEVNRLTQQVRRAGQRIERERRAVSRASQVGAGRVGEGAELREIASAAE